MAFPVYDVVTASKFSWFAFSLNVCLWLSQLPLMRVMIADNDPDSLARYSIVPTLFQAVASAMWLGYGLLTLKSPAIVANNAIGIVLSIVYVCIFVVKQPVQRDKVIAVVSFALSIGIPLLVYGTLYTSPYSDRDLVASALTTAITMLFWSSPMYALRNAVIQRDDKRVPVPLSVAMIMTTSSWLVVGALLGDIALIVSNIFGIALSTLQLIVIIWMKWKRRQNDASSTDNDS